MIIFIKKGAEARRVAALLEQLRGDGLLARCDERRGVVEIIGDCSRLDISQLAQHEAVAGVRSVEESFWLASRAAHPADTVVKVGGVSIGAGLTLIAGPCTVESEQQICAIAEQVREAGAMMLRGGAFKPRTSPYSFQGLGAEGLRLLLLAREKSGLPVVSEIMDAAQLPLFAEVDMLQVGARNMQNYQLLKALGRQKKPVLLKRSPAATCEELLLSAEYLLAEGNEQVVLCERGERSFEPESRSRLDITAIPLLKGLTHLPVIADPSHAAGRAALVPPLARAAVAAGADGLLVEVHNAPEQALCDGAQALRPEEFQQLAALCRK